MKLLTAIISTLLLIGCSSDPFIVPDPTSDNVVMLELKDKIANPGPFQPTYGWLFWYGPLAILLLMWGYRHLIRKPINCLEEEPTSTSVGKNVNKVEVDGTPGD
jgi:hypothetical protein